MSSSEWGVERILACHGKRFQKRLPPVSLAFAERLKWETIDSKQIDDIMNRMYHKCDNFVMEGFWECLYACVDELVDEESK